MTGEQNFGTALARRQMPKFIFKQRLCLKSVYWEMHSLRYLSRRATRDAV